MKKENIIIFSLILLLIVLFIVEYFICISSKTLINNNDFSKIYENKERVDAYIINSQKDEKVEITNSEDVNYILDLVKDEKIKSVKKGEEILGGNYSISFMLDDIETVINITNIQISINGKSYYTENNIKEKISDVIKKYTVNGINN